MPKVILKTNGKKVGISSRKFIGGLLHSHYKPLEEHTQYKPKSDSVINSHDVNKISKQILNLHLQKRKPITLKL